MWNLLLICAIAVLAKFSSALPQRHRNHIHFDGSIVDIVSGNYSVSSPAYAASVNVVKESTLDQLVDHFNHHEVRTFKQRYFVDETYWNKAADAPVFLCVGGEGPPLDRVSSGFSFTPWPLLSLFCKISNSFFANFNFYLLLLSERSYFQCPLQ